MYCRIRRESTLSELQETNCIKIFHLWWTTSTFTPFSDYRKPWLTFFFLRNYHVEKGDRYCYSVNVISECITQSFVVCQKYKQKHSMCQSTKGIRFYSVIMHDSSLNTSDNSVIMQIPSNLITHPLPPIKVGAKLQLLYMWMSQHENL